MSMGDGRPMTVLHVCMFAQLFPGTCQGHLSGKHMSLRVLRRMEEQRHFPGAQVNVHPGIDPNVFRTAVPQACLQLHGT